MLKVQVNSSRICSVDSKQTVTLFFVVKVLLCQSPAWESNKGGGDNQTDHSSVSLRLLCNSIMISNWQNK